MAAPTRITISDSIRHRPADAIATERTEDGKLTLDPKGHAVSATHAPQWSCPASCLFLGGHGCYAESGPMGYVTGRLNASLLRNPVDMARAEAEGIRKLTGRHPLRLHVVGDSRTNDAAIIVADAAMDYRAKHGQVAWTYTHAWRDVDRASWRDVSVLASCETPEDIRAATDKGYAVAMEWDAANPLPERIAGLKTFPCRQQTKQAPDCARCTDKGPACAMDGKLRGRAVVIFKLHGATKKAKAALAARQLAMLAS